MTRDQLASWMARVLMHAVDCLLIVLGTWVFCWCFFLEFRFRYVMGLALLYALERWF